MVTTNLITRFWKKVNKLGPIHPILKTRCWEWTASTDNGGYGIFKVGGYYGTMRKAHRVSWEIHCNAIPQGLCVLHKCDNCLCIRPTHLFLGTYLDNNRDREQKGRGNQVHGAQHYCAKLTDAHVLLARKLYAQGGQSYPKLACKFGVSCRAIYCAIKHMTWKHI